MGKVPEALLRFVPSTKLHNTVLQKTTKVLVFLKISDNGSFIVTVLYATLSGVSDVSAFATVWDLFVFQSSGDYTSSFFIVSSDNEA